MTQMDKEKINILKLGQQNICLKLMQKYVKEKTNA